jgi:GDP-L-fucose synthase
LLSLDSPPDWVNVGVGEDVTILELASLVAKTVGFTGEILTDPSKPDGTPRKLMDISRIKATGWSPEMPFETGLASAYQDFLSTLATGAARL